MVGELGHETREASPEVTAVVWTRAALDDLGEVRRYVAARNPRAANQLARTLLAAVERLRSYPASGRPGRVAGTRELAITDTRFVAIYRVTDDVVEILRVLHGARAWPAR